MFRERFPAWWRFTAIEHFSEDAIPIILAVTGSERIVVVQPRVHDDPGARVKTKKQSVLPEELCPEPVPVLRARSRSLPILCPARILRDNLERKVRNSREPFCCIFVYVADRIFPTQLFNLFAQLCQLFVEERMQENV